MTYSVPNIDTIDTRVKADMEATIDDVAIVRNRTPEAGIARAVAGASHENHQHISWTYGQIFPDTADEANLERQASFRGLTRRAASRATGALIFTGTDGMAVPASTRLGASGIEIETTEAGVIAGGTLTVAARAVLAGQDGTLASGTAASLLTPITGVSSSATVADPGFSGGADDEEKDALLDRLLFEMRNPPHGGAATDYVRWALEVPGITQAWTFGGEMGLGTVTLRVVVDDAPHGPIPTDAEVEAVQDYIDNRASTSSVFEGRPVTAQLFVVPPIAAPDKITLQIEPDTPAIRTAVQAELEALYRRTATPGGIVPITNIAQAVSLAPGLTGHALITPAVDAVPALGTLPTLGEVVYQ